MVAENSRSLFGRPTTRSYRAAVAKIIRDVKSRYGLTNEDLGERIGCDDDTVRNAEREAGSLNAVTLLNIGYEFGEEAIEPVRQLYLCAPAEPLDAIDHINRAEQHLAVARHQLSNGAAAQ